MVNANASRDNHEQRISALENELLAIKKRNALVEQDKAWETSWSRRIIIAIMTYIIIGIYMQQIGTEGPWLNAVIPTAGFILSTLALPFIKKVWMLRGYHGKKIKQ